MAAPSPNDLYVGNIIKYVIPWLRVKKIMVTYPVNGISLCLGNGISNALYPLDVWPHNGFEKTDKSFAKGIKSINH